MASRVHILGIDIDNLGEDEAIQCILSLVEEGTPHHVVTINPEFMVLAQADPEFKRVLNKADLALADGIGLLWASRILGTPLKARVAGVDTITALAREASERGYCIFLLGAADGVAEAAGCVLKSRYPGLCIAGTYAGSPALEEEENLVKMIRAAAPHLLFVAFGAPHQDLWIRRNLERMTVPVSMGVGGSFDFISGVAKRAPSWMRRVGLEWLYRLTREPWRWRRMLRLPSFAWLVILSALNRRRP